MTRSYTPTHRKSTAPRILSRLNPQRREYFCRLRTAIQQRGGKALIDRDGYRWLQRDHHLDRAAADIAIQDGFALGQLRVRLIGAWGETQIVELVGMTDEWRLG